MMGHLVVGRFAVEHELEMQRLARHAEAPPATRAAMREMIERALRLLPPRFVVRPA